MPRPSLSPNPSPAERCADTGAAAGSVAGMSHFAVHYSYVPDAALLDQHRPAHREFLRALVGSGVVAAGAYPGAEEPSALLIVEADTADDVAAMLDDDPFLLHGAIAGRRIQLWNPPIGIFA